MIILILLIGLILRVINLNQSLWLDEAINVVYSQQYNFWDFLTKYPVGDFHPPGYFFILWICSRLFGTSEIAVRLPSVIFGIATIYLIFLIGKKLFDKKTGLIAAFLLTIAPLHVYYSQEARMYSLAAFAVALSTYFLLSLNENKKLLSIGYMLSLILVFYSDYIAYFIIPVHLFFIILAQKNLLKKYLILFSTSFLFLIPWLFIFKEQIQIGVNAANSLSGWRNIVGGSSLKDLGLIYTKTILGRTSFDNKVIYLVVILFSLLILLPIIYKSVRKINYQVLVIIGWIIIPIMLSLLISFFIPVLSYFRLLFILPAIYLLLGHGLSKFSSLPRFILTSLIVALSIFALSRYYLEPKFQREDWKNAVFPMNVIAANEGAAILFENDNIPAPALYYSTDPHHSYPGLKKIPAQDLSDLNNTDIIFQSFNKILLYEYLVDVTDPKRLLQQNIEQEGFKRVNTYNFNGVGFVHLYQLETENEAN